MVHPPAASSHNENQNALVDQKMEKIGSRDRNIFSQFQTSEPSQTHDLDEWDCFKPRFEVYTPLIIQSYANRVLKAHDKRAEKQVRKMLLDFNTHQQF